MLKIQVSNKENLRRLDEQNMKLIDHTKESFCNLKF